MTLPSSGSISANQINDEFFDLKPVAMSEYRGRAYFGGTLPASPNQIAYSNFRGISRIYTIDVLILAGGGGGGDGQNENEGDGSGVGGGGGAGGLRLLSFAVPNNNTPITVVVGGGGVGSGNRLVKGTNGQQSYIILDGVTHNCLGGGGGGSAGTNATARPGADGGCGGGAGARFSNDPNNTNRVDFLGGQGTYNPNQGNRGGNSLSKGRKLTNPGAWGGGGGGSQSAGEDAGGDNPGKGGTGYNLNLWMGSANYRGSGNGIAGGGGGAKRGGGVIDQPSEPGKGGGGIGDGLFPPPTPGAPASGGGGGGSQGKLNNPQVRPSEFPGQNGGYGAVVIRYIDTGNLIPGHPEEHKVRGIGGTVSYAVVDGIARVFHTFITVGTFTFIT